MRIRKFVNVEPKPWRGGRIYHDRTCTDMIRGRFPAP